MASIDARVGQREIDRAAAEVEAAGGMEGGGAEVAAEMDLAGALADALAGQNVDDFGFIAAQDLENEQDQGGYSPGEQERMDAAAAQAERNALAARMAELDAAIAYSTSGVEGGAASNP